MKVCCKCGEELPGFMFNKCSRSKDGLYPRCRKCRGKGNKKTIIRNTAKSKFGRKRLMAPYVKLLLIRNGFDEATINRYPQLIAIKRVQVKTKRILKTINNDN